MKRLNEKISDLTRTIQNMKKVVVAFSGGTDSSLLLFLCKQILDNDVIAATLHSPLQKKTELEKAIEITKRLGVEHLIIEKDVLMVPEIAKNRRDRCYHCKKTIIMEILRYMESYPGYSLIDGSNFTDMSSKRPGLKALKESGIASPLAGAGITKAEVLEISRKNGLLEYGPSSDSCLATRFLYDRPLNREAMSRIELIEEELFEYGLGDTRLRDHGDIARIETSFEKFHNLERSEIDTIIEIVKKQGYKYVTIDLEGYRSGSMDL